MPETKSSGTAIALSFFWTGLGQLYAGRIARGLIMLAVTPILWAIGWFWDFAGTLGASGTSVAPTAAESATAGGFGVFGILLTLVLIAWWIWGMVDAKNLCEAFKRGVPT